MSALLTVADFGALIHRSESWVSRQVNKRAIPHLRIGRTPYFTEQHVADYLASVEVEADVSHEQAVAASWGRKTRGAR